jgi:hypothetical protein
VNKLSLKALPKRIVGCEGSHGPGGDRSAGATEAHRALGCPIELLAVELTIAVAQQRKELVAERLALRVSGDGHGRQHKGGECTITWCNLTQSATIVRRAAMHSDGCRQKVG